METGIAAFGRIDIVVNNTGTVGAKTIVQNDPGPGFQAELDVHVIDALQINRAEWPHMARQRHGRLLFTGSAVALGGYRGPAGYEGSYAAAKASLVGVTRRAAAAGEDFDIKANILMPWTYTPMVDGNLSGTPFGAWMAANLRVKQVAASVALLLREDCPVTGQAVSSAGGRVTRILLAGPPHYFNPDLTPEDVRDHWDAIAEAASADGPITGLMEVRDQPHEYELICDALGTKN